MSIKVQVPNLPESIADATVAAWHKQPGETVQKDENLVDLETDKVVLEVPAPENGILKEIRYDQGATVKSGELLAVIDTRTEEETEEKTEEKIEPAKPEEKTERPKAAPLEEPEAVTSPLSPAVRRLIHEYHLDPIQIKGTGKDGRLTKTDVLHYIEQQQETAGPVQEKPKEAAPPAAEIKPAAKPVERVGERLEQRVAMTRLRARIAERLLQAQQNAAMLTTFNEVNLQRIRDLRLQYRDSFEKKHGIKLGFMSFFVKAVIEALKRFPVVNASIDEQEIIYHGYYDIGIAVSTERGLVVPILRDADQLDFASIEKKIADYAVKAREGKLAFEELSGGTFTITNGGIFGSMLSTPILNPPQSAILGMHAIKERPVVEAGEIVIRPMMYLALSYDHRLIDGREAVLFLVAMKECLEDPARLLLQI